MKINVSYDSSAASAPAGFTAAVASAVRFYETNFTNNITINLTFQWAALSAGDVSSSQQSPSYDQSYSTVVRALKTSASSSTSMAAVASLPSVNPFSGEYFVSTAEGKAIGLTSANASSSDGTVTLNSSLPYTFDSNNRSVPGQYDAIGALEHEISEDLGRAMGSDGSLFLEPLALFRDSTPGVIDTSSSYAGASFSPDGRTLTSPMGEQGSDLADWGGSVQGDSFGYLSQGLAATVSNTDLQVMNVLGYKLFDPYEYIASYADLIKAIGDNPAAGTNHWLSYGYDEGRTVTFDGLDYIASYTDLIHAFGANADAGASHYIDHGLNEGRTTTFDGLDYIASYKDLIGALGANNDAGATHYIDYGVNEGRTTTFDGLDYIASYKDLISAFGANNDAGATHYIGFGVNEGRTTTFDGLSYIAQNADLMKAYGANNDAGATHYIDYGLQEGRSTQFNVAAYESKHTDLIGKYANNDQFLTAYINTYHNTGTFLT